MNRLLPVVCVALWVALLAWAGTIIYLSSLSGKELQTMVTFEFWDKAAHFAAFMAGGALAAASLRTSTRWAWGKVVLWAVILLAVFGGTDELHQLYTPGRSGGDVFDWMADVLGAIAGAFLVRGGWRWLPSPVQAAR